MARMKANYPDWVMKHKTKGRYINFIPPDKYYLYEAHSVRDKETGRSYAFATVISAGLRKRTV